MSLNKKVQTSMDSILEEEEQEERCGAVGFFCQSKYKQTDRLFFLSKQIFTCTEYTAYSTTDIMNIAGINSDQFPKANGNIRETEGTVYSALLNIACSDVLSVA